MKKYIYNETQLTGLILLLGKLEVKGLEQARILASVANIIDDAKIEEIQEEGEEEGE